MKYVDRTFVDDGIVLDGNSFTRCTFDGCVAFYNGGPLEIVGGLTFKNGGNIRYGPGVDAFDNPLSNLLVESAERQGFRQVSDDEVAGYDPIAPKKDLR
ncbi:hypothetical protein EV292_11278 [Sphingomonas sp. BK235]|nr:hypothetical protein EV292_11278 [Sphingomonas sp. BK235]